MSETKPKQQQPVAAVPEQDDAARIVYRAKGFWEKYSKSIIYGGLAIILIAGGWFAYKKFIAEPNENKAAEAIWKAQQYLEKDSIRLALVGDGRNAGFEKVAKTYGGTKSGNLAKYYTGLCYLKLNDPTKAITFLKDFSTDSKPLQAFAYARLGDAYGDLNKNAESIENYDKAGHHFPDDEANSSESLFRAGLRSEIAGKNEDAIKYYKEVREKYFRSERGRNIDAYLARLGNLDKE
jgi:tetratricopeptide (TPR) repeat protein